MSDFISSIVSRHAEALPAISPRLPARFEAQQPSMPLWGESASFQSAIELPESLRKSSVDMNPVSENTISIVPSTNVTSDAGGQMASNEIELSQEHDNKEVFSMPSHFNNRDPIEVHVSDNPGNHLPFLESIIPNNDTKAMMVNVPINEKNEIVVNHVSIITPQEKVSKNENMSTPSIKPKKDIAAVGTNIFQNIVTPKNEPVISPLMNSTVVKVSIGRIEVKAISPGVTNQSKTSKSLPQQPRMSLDEYLKKRNTTES